MKAAPLSFLLALVGCVGPSVAPESQSATAGTVGAARPAPLDPPMASFDGAAVRAEVEADVAARLGAEAVRLAAAAPSSILVTHHQGLPRPVRNADGSWGYEPPGANAMIRTTAGWRGWAGTESRAVSPAKAAEIERIFAEASFWAEPEVVPPTCTDAGARRMVLRHAGRVTVRQQSCGGVGLTGRLWELVYSGPG